MVLQVFPTGCGLVDRGPGRKLQRSQALNARSVRAKYKDAERDEAPGEVRDRRPIGGIHLRRCAQVEPIDGDVRSKRSASRRVSDRVEAGATDVVAYSPRSMDELAKRVAGRISLHQKIASERVHHCEDLILELHQPRCGFVTDFE